MAVPVSDRLFRYAFSSPENARDLARNLLPPRYHHVVEEARVSVDSKSYIEAELREQLTDLLICFDRPAGDAALYLYVLVEHKSQPEHWTTFQLLRYMLAVWSDVLRREGSEPKRLPPILPVVLYQGTREWDVPRTFEALIESADGEVPGESSAVHIPHHIPRFEPLFVNLQSHPDENFHGGVRAVVALLFLKYLARRIDRTAAQVLLDAMHREGVTHKLREYFQAFYTAFLQTKSTEEIDIFIAEAARRRYHDSEEDLMTYAEELMTRGREEGRVTDKQDVLIRLLTRKFGITDAERQLIEATDDTAALDAALDELVVADTKEAVLEKLR
jgi:predicted transposase YdaD